MKNENRAIDIGAHVATAVFSLALLAVAAASWATLLSVLFSALQFFAQGQQLS